jgi:hypothetical protein
MVIRYRRAGTADIPPILKLIEPDRPLLSVATRAALPCILKKLLEYQRILLCLIEDAPTRRPRFVGGSGFLPTVFIQQALRESGRSWLEAALSSELNHNPVFLNSRQIAGANRRGDLRLLNFFGSTRKLGTDDPRAPFELGAVAEAWSFFHKGFQFEEVWIETADPIQAGLLSGMGIRIVAEEVLRNGANSRLFSINRREALERPVTWPHSGMLSDRPVLGFTRAQRQLLELALLDVSDAEAAKELCLAEDALKKRWRSIYRIVTALEPHVFEGVSSPAMRRRALMRRLRHNLCELRPY